MSHPLIMRSSTAFLTRISVYLVAAILIAVLSCPYVSSQEKQNVAIDADAQKAAKDDTTTLTHELLELLKIQNQSKDRFTDAWLLTLKEIVDEGPAAVSELIEELDATDDNMMLRCLGFMLRAIGDKRAVPALIRAIPKTLLPPGSDMGLRSNDPELAKFARENDLDQKHQRPDASEYGFGRPVREIFGALQKLTGTQREEEELFHTFRDGTARQIRMKQELFQKQAQHWAEWWETHWAEYVQDKMLATVKLVRLPDEKAAELPLDEARFKTTGGGSNWVLESVFNRKSRRVFYDFDTGRTAGLPKKWRTVMKIEDHLQEITAWAEEQGFDIMGTEYDSPVEGHRVFAIKPLGLKAYELGQDRWKMSSENIGFRELQEEGTEAKDWLLHIDESTKSIDPLATATFLFLTREGTPGLIFIGIEVQDDSLQPGGIQEGDNELNPVAFRKGRRFGFSDFEEVSEN